MRNFDTPKQSQLMSRAARHDLSMKFNRFQNATDSRSDRTTEDNGTSYQDTDSPMRELLTKGHAVFLQPIRIRRRLKRAPHANLL